MSSSCSYCYIHIGSGFWNQEDWYNCNNCSMRMCKGCVVKFCHEYGEVKEAKRPTCLACSRCASALVKCSNVHKVTTDELLDWALSQLKFTRITARKAFLLQKGEAYWNGQKLEEGKESKVQS